MADKKTYTVEALLKATDAGFTKTLKGAAVMMGGLGKGANKTSSMFKSMFGANLASSALVGGLRMAKNGVVSMVSELNSSNIAWKSFEGNMKIMGKSTSEITNAKKEMQDYATQTIYSASDMASTYAQLASVGVKNTGRLVRGFGGLAAAAENPKQAMKTLSQQATQMAAKPQVAWQDFKLMMEQTPAGIAAVAKEMGMSTQELVKSVQDGKISTEDFFDAIEKVGTTTSFTKMATDFKSVGQAIDGVKEGLANKLQPAFEEFNKFGIEAFKALASQLDQVNFDKLATSVRNTLSDIKKFFAILGGTGAFSALKSMLDEIGKAIGHVFSSFTGKGDEVTNAGIMIGDAIVKVAGHIEDLAKWISKLDPSTIKAVAKVAVGILVAFKGIKVALGIGGLVSSFFGLFSKGSGKAGRSTNKLGQLIESLGKSIGNAAKGIGTGFGKALEGLGKGLSKINPAQWLGIAVAILAVGGAVLIASFGFERMANAAATLSEAGVGAMVMFTVMLGGLIGLVAVVGIFGAGLTAGALGMLAFGAAAIMVGIAIAIVATQADGVSKIIHAIGDAFSQVALAIGMAVTMILTALPPVIVAITGLVTAVANGISQIVLAIATGVSMIINSLTGLMIGISMVINSITGAIQAFSGMLKTIFDGISQVITAVAEGIKTVLTGLGDAFKALGESIKLVLDGVKEVITGFGDAVRTILDGIAKIFDSMGTAALNAGKGTLKIAEGISTLVALPMGDLIGTLRAVARGLGKIAGHAGGLTSAGSATVTLASGLSQVASSGNSAVSALKALPSSVTSIGTAFTSASSTVETAMNSMVNAVKTGGNQMKSSAKSDGTQAGKNFATGISSANGAVSSAVSSLVSTAVNRARQGASAMRSAGSYIGQGLAQGMMSALGAVTAAANALVAQAERAARAKAQIHSPSRLFRDNVGIYIGQGVAVGIERSQKYVDEAMNGMFDTINSFDFASTGLFDSNLALDMGAVSANISTDSTNQNRLMTKLIDTMQDVANRDLVLNVNDREIARAAGDAINEYTTQKQTAIKRLGGDI